MKDNALHSIEVLKMAHTGQNRSFGNNTSSVFGSRWLNRLFDQSGFRSQNPRSLSTAENEARRRCIASNLLSERSHWLFIALTLIAVICFPSFALADNTARLTDQSGKIQAKWFKKSKQVRVSGVKAAPGSRVHIFDGKHNRLGKTRVHKNGQWRFKRRLRRGRCEIQVRIRKKSYKIAVQNAPERCSARAKKQIRVTKARWIARRSMLVIKGRRAQKRTKLSLVNAETFEQIAMIKSNRKGRFNYRRKLSVPPCSIRVGINGEYTDSVNVRGARPFCQTDPNEPVPPVSDPGTPTPTEPEPPTPPEPEPPAPIDPEPPIPQDPEPPLPSDPGLDPEPTDPDSSGPDPEGDALLFSKTVYPLVRENCSNCHTQNAVFADVMPFIAHENVNTAFDAVVDNQKVNLKTPENSRLVQRLLNDKHHCWSNCDDDAETMRQAIETWAVQADGQEPGGNQPEKIASAAMTFAESVEDTSSIRYDEFVIARFEFAEGAGETARDSSGIEPAMDLELTGVDWLPGNGIEIKSGKASATEQTSAKLYELIANPNTGSNEFSVEAWITPANTDQGGPARIVTYSRNTSSRNFTMGQEKSDYVFRNTSAAEGISGNGTPNLITSEQNDVLQTNLQHVVMTFDQQVGRKIFVNGNFTGDDDPNGPGSLSRWTDRNTFVLGNEVTNNRLWMGKIHFVAIYNRALTAQQINQNFVAGIGSKYLLRFDISSWTGLQGSAIEFEVSEFDNYSYLFGRPTYQGPNPNGIRIRNMQIAVNDRVPVSGQAFVNVDTVVNSASQLLSPLASVVTKDRGPGEDTFSIIFEVLGGYQVTVNQQAPVQPPITYEDNPMPDIGMRNFDQINNTMATLTGVNPDSSSVRNTFNDLKQQLPGGYDVRTFVSAHQVGIFKLAFQYCDEMVRSRNLREDFFDNISDIGTNQGLEAVFPARTDEIIDQLVTRMIGNNLANQPSRAELRPILRSLVTQVSSNNDASTVLTSTCAAVLGSAPVLLY